MNSRTCSSYSACKDVKDQTHVDDGLVADVHGRNENEDERDEILDHASMPNEGWTFLGDVSVSSVPISTDVLEDRVSGLAWDSELDTFYGQCRTRSKD